MTKFSPLHPIKKDYEKLTELVYGKLAWGPLFRAEKTDANKVLKNLDNNAEKYILESLEIMKIKIKNLKNLKVLDIGTGRHARFFAKHGAIVDHFDLSKDNVTNLNKWAKKNKKKINSTYANINHSKLKNNYYDIIFLAGVYQHIDIPAFALHKFINSLKPKGKMYLGFYRSGEFKFFIVDAIREFMTIKMIKKIRSINSILFSFNEKNSYATSRVMDDFFVPRKHCFHPKDVISDIKLLNGEIFYFKKDLRDYCHNSKTYFSVGGDRIYITKKNDKIVKLSKVKKKLQTVKGKNQLHDVKYKDPKILRNIFLFKSILKKFKDKKISEDNIISLCIGLYQFTRPCVLEESNYYQEALRVGRVKMLSVYLENFHKNFVLD